MLKLKLIQGYLKAGKSVVDSSRNFRKEERQSARRITSNLDIEVVTIFVNTPKAVAYQRLLENRQKKERCDVTDENFAELLQGMEPPIADENPLIFQYGDQIDLWIAKNILAIR